MCRMSYSRFLNRSTNHRRVAPTEETNTMNKSRNHDLKKLCKLP